MATLSLTDILKEARRRRVFRVIALYVIGVWVVLQVFDLAFASWGIPSAALRNVWIAAVVGFPVAVVLGWRYDIVGGRIVRTPTGDKDADLSIGRTDYVILGALAIVTAVITSGLVTEISRTQISDTTPLVATGTDPKSIAVLPFVNMSSDAEQEYFSDGLSEEILNLLTKISGLKVIGRTSSFAFKGTNTDLRDIGQTLDVKTVLEGSVRKSGDQVRITAQLVDVSDGAQIWSETYERTMTEIFSVQDEVAASIIDALQMHVGANPTRGRPTNNARAYALFLRARAPFHTKDWRDTEALLLQVIDLDPGFAEAHERLAHLYWTLSGQFITSAKGRKLAYDAAANALAIDPDLVLAQAMYESASPETWSYLGEIEAFERAAREEPGNTEVLGALAYYLLQTGYIQEALGVAGRLVEIEPLSPSANGSLFGPLYAAGRTSEAVAALDVVFDKYWLGEVYLAEKQDDIAIANFEAIHKQAGLPFDWVNDLVTAARDPATGQLHLDRRIPQIIATFPEIYRAVTQQSLNRWYLYFGFIDRYFETILDSDLADSAWTDADHNVNEGTIYRRLGFTAHPKYLEVADLRGIIDVWEQRGPPDFCKKVDGQWVCE